MTSSSPSASLLDLARTIALEAGELAARRRGEGVEGVEVAATKSTIVDVVTQADRDVESLIRERIAAARPDDAVLGESVDSSKVFRRSAPVNDSPPSGTQHSHDRNVAVASLVRGISLAP